MTLLEPRTAASTQTERPDPPTPKELCHDPA